MGDARSRLDDDFECDGFGAPLGCLDRRDQRVDGIDVACVANFGDHDLVQAVAGLLQQVHDIAVPERCVEPVDANGQGLGAPIDATDGFDDIGAGAVLVRGRDTVFEIQVDDVGGRGRHFFEDRGTRARTEQLAPVRAGGWRGL